MKRQKFKKPELKTLQGELAKAQAPQSKDENAVRVLGLLCGREQ